MGAGLGGGPNLAIVTPTGARTSHAKDMRAACTQKSFEAESVSSGRYGGGGDCGGGAGGDGCDGGDGGDAGVVVGGGGGDGGAVSTQAVLIETVPYPVAEPVQRLMGPVAPVGWGERGVERRVGRRV